MDTEKDQRFVATVNPQMHNPRVISEEAGFRRSLAYGLWIRLRDPLLRRRTYRDGLKSKR